MRGMSAKRLRCMARVTDDLGDQCFSLFLFGAQRTFSFGASSQASQNIRAVERISVTKLFS
jgi:hypothetical protein